MTEDSGWAEYEGHVYFLDCTCAHEPEDHGWGYCKVLNCPCEGGYEE